MDHRLITAAFPPASPPMAAPPRPSTLHSRQEQRIPCRPSTV
nr:hypothetical protein asmbl_1 [uncultured bacterium]